MLKRMGCVDKQRVSSRKEHAMRTLMYAALLLSASLAWGWDNPFIETPTTSPFSPPSTSSPTVTTDGTTYRVLSLQHLDPRLLAEAFNIKVVNLYGSGTQPAPTMAPTANPAANGNWWFDPARGWVNRVTGEVVPAAGGANPYPTYPQPYPTYPTAQPYPAYPQPYPTYPTTQPYPTYPSGTYPPTYQPYAPYPAYVDPATGYPYPRTQPYTGTPYSY
jgi:hypothetical protein